MGDQTLSAQYSCEGSHWLHQKNLWLGVPGNVSQCRMTACSVIESRLYGSFASFAFIPGGMIVGPRHRKKAYVQIQKSTYLEVCCSLCESKYEQKR